MSPLRREFERIKLAPDFYEDEFRCPCPRHERNEPTGMKMDEFFIVMLQDIRDEAKIPFTITSGYRCKDYQIELHPEVPNSAHMRGMAVDIRCESIYHRHKILSAALPRCNRIGIGTRHLHLDSDPNLASGVVWMESDDEVCATIGK